MILTFSKDRFVDAIKNGSKIHTIREDKGNRWKAGMKIHFWRGNPRNLSKNPYRFMEGECKGTEKISIYRNGNATPRVTVDFKPLSVDEVHNLAKNDGLTIDEFRMWFVPPGLEVFNGKIIHWTEGLYGLPF